MTQGGDSVKHGSEIVAIAVDDSGLNRNVLRRALECIGITRVLEVADCQECMSMMPELTPCHVKSSASQRSASAVAAAEALSDAVSPAGCSVTVMYREIASC